MALDRQRILNDLGNVMNQLQNADCGCMGKLFSNQGGNNSMNAVNNPSSGYGGYNSGCCHDRNRIQYGQNSGEPCSQPAKSCMGCRCNPAQLYAETFGYLNSNVMQPVMKEVHDELMDISPANTIMNNPMGQQMGLSTNNNLQPQSAKMNQMPMAHLEPGNVNNSMNPGADAMGGLGPQIANMMFSSNSNPNRMPKIKTGQDLADQGMAGQGMAGQGMSGQGMAGQGIAGQGFSGQVMPGQGMVGQGMTGQGIPGQGMSGQGMSAQGMVGNGMAAQGMTGQGMPGQQGMAGQSMVGQGMGGQSMTGQNNIQNNMMNPTTQYMTSPNTSTNPPTQMGNINKNLPANQMASNRPNSYGIHTQGIAKFKEVFPGIAQDDLGFDPMTIALQMNPANQQKVAIDTMNNLMNNNQIINSNKIPQQVKPPELINAPPSIVNQQAYQQNVPTIPLQQQQYYVTNTNTNSPQPLTQDNLEISQKYEQGEAQQQQLSERNQFVKEAIYPVDVVKNQLNNYNTLGQPVQLLPPNSYKTPLPNLPQTLSPQATLTKRISQSRMSNVKSTISKTSLMGMKAVGKTPSRNQLQHIYNQYKGSQSYTQQNVTPLDQRIHSDGKLNVANTHLNPDIQAPIEKVGDSLSSNVLNNITKGKVELMMGQSGDVPASNKPTEEIKTPATPYKKCRNGLQDQTFSTYPTGTSWSFHGTSGDRVPYQNTLSKGRTY